MEETAISLFEHCPREIWHKILAYLHHWRFLHLKRVCKLFDAYISNFRHDITDMEQLTKLMGLEKDLRKWIGKKYKY